MADENVIIEANEQNVGEYDPNPYDNVTVEEALKQLFNRFTPRTVRQAIFTMAENNKPATLVEKSITENGEYSAKADNADGYSKVTVDVAGGGGGETFEVTLTTDNSFNIVEASETFSTVFQKVIDGDYIKFTFSIPDEEPYAAAGYFLSQNGSTHENEALLIVLQASVLANNKNTAICFKWYADNTFSSMIELDEIEM